MAQAIKALVIFSRYQRGITRQVSNYNRELIKPASITSPDLLLQDLKNASSTSRVLELVAAHNKIMNNKHVIQALRSLFTLQKHGSSNVSTTEILSHPNFAKLCRQLKYQAGAIELVDTIDALKVVSYVGVSSNSTVVQVLLQLVRHNINQLNLQQVIFLDFLLNQFNQSSPLIDALKIALPLVFEIQFNFKMDANNISALTDYLHYASKNRVTFSTIEKITQSMLSHNEEWDAKTAKSIIWSICNIDSDELFKPLLKKAIKSLVIRLDEISYVDMESTLTKLIHKYDRKYPFYYDEVLFDSCANYVIDHDLGYNHAIYILRKFGRVDHINNSLLDYATKKVNNNPDLIKNGTPAEVYSIIVSMAMTDFKPVYWENFKQLITAADINLNVNKRELILIKFGASICLLNIFKVDVLNYCLKPEFLNSLFKKNYNSDIQNYITIWQSIKLNKPELSCLLSKKYTPEQLVKRIWNDHKYPFEAVLHKGLGGEIYVKTGLYSKCGTIIDHVVIFRKGGYPVACNQEVEYIEDLEVVPDNQIILIQGLRKSDYTLNNMRIKSSTTLSLKFLEFNGFIVVPICIESWQNLPDFEKVPFIMQKIKEKQEIDISMRNVI